MAYASPVKQTIQTSQNPQNLLKPPKPPKTSKTIRTSRTTFPRSPLTHSPLTFSLWITVENPGITPVERVGETCTRVEQPGQPEPAPGTLWVFRNLSRTHSQPEKNACVVAGFHIAPIHRMVKKRLREASLDNFAGDKWWIALYNRSIFAVPENGVTVIPKSTAVIVVGSF
ncbi:hypothetical protein GCM10028786_22830 [Flaviaesturariibacter terrae]